MFGAGEWIAIMGMILTLLLVLIIGGFILLFPLARRLGNALDQWIRIKRQEGMSDEEMARLQTDVDGFRQLMESVSDRLERVEEQQQFVETLIEQKEAPTLPHSETG